MEENFDYKKVNFEPEPHSFIFYVDRTNDVKRNITLQDPTKTLKSGVYYEVIKNGAKAFQYQTEDGVVSGWIKEGDKVMLQPNFACFYLEDISRPELGHYYYICDSHMVIGRKIYSE